MKSTPAPLLAALTDKSHKRGFVTRTATNNKTHLALARAVSGKYGARILFVSIDLIWMSVEYSFQHFVDDVIGVINEFFGLTFAVIHWALHRRVGVHRWFWFFAWSNVCGPLTGFLSSD